QVLQALRGPERIAIVHLRGHQKGPTPLVRGNNLADQEAKQAALRTHSKETIKKTRGDGIDCEIDTVKTDTHCYGLSFTVQEKEKLLQMGIEEKEKGHWKLPDGREVLPKSLALR
ncbi:hypothetical protein FQV18_0011727, partial [Eudyptula minor novaehollandiae]